MQSWNVSVALVHREMSFWFTPGTQRTPDHSATIYLPASVLLTLLHTTSDVLVRWEQPHVNRHLTSLLGTSESIFLFLQLHTVYSASILDSDTFCCVGSVHSTLDEKWNNNHEEWLWALIWGYLATYSLQLQIRFLAYSDWTQTYVRKMAKKPHMKCELLTIRSKPHLEVVWNEIRLYRGVSDQMV